MEVKKGNHADGTGSVMHQREENHRSGKGGHYMQHKRGFIELEGSSSSRMSIEYHV